MAVRRQINHCAGGRYLGRPHFWPSGLTFTASGVTIIGMEPRIASLEAITECTAKAVEELRRRVDEGFRELRCELREMRAEFSERINGLRWEMRSEIRDVRNESNERYKELRTEMREMFRWLIGIQITTLLALLGLLAKAADMF